MILVINIILFVFVKHTYLLLYNRGGVCIYYCESLAVQLVKISYLNECLLCEVSLQKKVTLQCYIDAPTKIDWKLILLLLLFVNDIHSSNPDFSVILGSFLMLDRRIGGLLILKNLKTHKLVLSQLLMDLDN